MTRGSGDAVRAAAADLDLLERAVEAERSAKTHTMEIARQVMERRALTAEQVAGALGITRRALYKRLGPA